MAPAPGGPRPEVLARLAEGVPAEQRENGISVRARLLGLVLCAATAGMVLASIFLAGGS